MNKIPHELEQENIELRQAVVNEKLKKAEALFTHRLVYTAIIFVILFIILNVAMDESNSGIQWFCIIVFFAIVFIVVAKIFGANAREEKDALNNP
jgi:cell division protein FtsW (lipid II flippase)